MKRRYYFLPGRTALEFTVMATLVIFAISTSGAQTKEDKFAQMYDLLPTPNTYRTASGMPGHEYWQQQADYTMNLELDDEKQRLYGVETITYHNNSPDQLEFLWLQLDQNLFEKESDTYKTRTNTIESRMSLQEIKGLTPSFDGGNKIEFVKDATGKPLPYTIVKTMMRIDLPKPLKSKEKISFQIKWWQNINNRMEVGGRSGYEYFAADGNYLYTVAQYFPRMCVYSDDEGWQNKQFLGKGEFTLPFGNYDVSITVPADHLIAASGVLQNAKEVLDATQLKRMEQAKSERKTPVIIATEAEAIAREKGKSKAKRTWKFKAENVRDFAFASSRKFIWDAMGVEMSNGSVVMAMSMYPKEGNPLWERYSTKVVAHTLNWYSHYTFDYPYPVAWSVHTDRIGMEYPMICFNGGRPDADGTYSERTKYGMLTVVIHEVGHNWFPMIVNSDERQWTWMDEGLNSFLQYLTEQQWERDYPSSRGPAERIVDYMIADNSVVNPIMTNSEQVVQLGNNAYGKPATALNILRETVMGRELFDFSFKTYSNRWKFKHPSPADFFRTMEEASGVDLDWFWRGWFFTTEHVDIAIDDVKAYRLNSKNPDIENPIALQERSEAPKTIGSIRNAASIKQTQDEIDPSLRDFYTDYDPLAVSVLDKEAYAQYTKALSEEDKQLLSAGNIYYEISLSNKGGLVMPLILLFEYADGSSEEQRIPAEIWRMNSEKVSKVFVSDKEITRITLDPYLETADSDTENNYFPARKKTINRFDLFKQRSGGAGEENPMQRDKRAKQKENGSN